MQNSPTEYPEYSEYHTLEVTNNFNDLPHENESVPLLTNPLPQRIVSQQNNNSSMNQNLQIFYNSINTFEEIINRQLEQVNELKTLLNQMSQSFITHQQQAPMPRRISRNYVTRPHPYLNERLVSSRTPTIRSAMPTYRHECFTEQLASSNSLHRQQTNVPAETTDNEIFPSDIQNYEFW
ncbi:uncharacterized protein OCT59_014673 [Rhizophagus irregularis]|uniref:Uncharacterized protein n=3 Tax=Rhizophagus irregularis TaxID=588596 RepID=U9TMW5_RHIID|nr:hypothetical protein GLOIN_2v1490316 [Rhizophagus irregularis DAOM 181602=DAOM 197198]EXX77136.1 hypothetical protein RirG_026550 [Rhizophagus irregularis DAOM 197198w]PKY16082.1 hypothetical protein RhiirB3_467125 [Rhizophagus irregularis]POG83206.1 hypothetical protein GLOIN_2v1490316 [Rhizophagus irregularis DAOM 181602=DAOM 197198]UZO22309.1 hypothetical protein OCT59_014673 [Rhizophagus irregularis]CAB5372030.1 unnamed protein product [Rhizophagus irregularis]|eukprot:XP_025190072.1 hypothetical protein GLOIN_2v1490316 [Rhizophagus irregularis DAOM 181602=DAOM 197198]